MSQDVDPVRLVLWSRSVPDARSPVPGALSEVLRLVQGHRGCVPASRLPEPEVRRGTAVVGLLAVD